MTRRLIIMLALGVALAVAILFGVTQCQVARTAKTQAGLAKGQTGAAMQSGQDAVETLGNATARDAAVGETVKDGTNEIDRAPEGDRNDAADRATCRMRSYRNQPKCVALLGPAPD